MDGGNEICGDFEGLSIVGGGKQFVSEAADLMLELPHWSLLRNRVVVDHVDGDDSGLASLDWESQTDVKRIFFYPRKSNPHPVSAKCAETMAGHPRVRFFGLRVLGRARGFDPGPLWSFHILAG